MSLLPLRPYDRLLHAYRFYGLFFITAWLILTIVDIVTQPTTSREISPFIRIDLPQALFLSLQISALVTGALAAIGCFWKRLPRLGGVWILLAVISVVMLLLTYFHMPTGLYGDSVTISQWRANYDNQLLDFNGWYGSVWVTFIYIAGCLYVLPFALWTYVGYWRARRTIKRP